MKFNNILAFLAAAVLAAAMPPTLSAQPEMIPNPEIGTPLFFYDVLVYKSDKQGKSRVDVYIQVPHDHLRFVREGNQFIARYEVVLGLYDKDKQLLQERSYINTVRVADYQQTTNRRLSHVSQRFFEVDPGEYYYAVRVRDQDSEKEGKAERKVTVPDFRSSILSASDIMLVSRVTVEDNTVSVVPNISRMLHNSREGFYFFLFAYRMVPVESLSVRLTIKNRKNENLVDTLRFVQMRGDSVEILLPVKDVNLPIGNYMAIVEIRPSGADSDVKATATVSKTFVVRWSDIPYSITDIDKAIDQLRYIATSEEMGKMREPKDSEERKRRFLSFWETRDPNPQSPRNELMDEYYRRIEFSNQTFGNYQEGWKTDMGMVYIRFGPPENVERHPFDTDTKPYEIWYYYQQNRQFVFVDESGFGDYRLRYPNLDLWGRIR